MVISHTTCVFFDVLACCDNLGISHCSLTRMKKLRKGGNTRIAHRCGVGIRYVSIVIGHRRNMGECEDVYIASVRLKRFSYHGRTRLRGVCRLCEAKGTFH